NAEAAHALGIVNAVVPGSELLTTAMAKAQLLSEKPPAALRTTKALLKRSTTESIADAMTAETEKFAALLQGPEAREAMMAFMQRRKPDFSKF
ncbi:MAG TPA: enoyl-CoA hydratase-related protein, partial [Candidatus Angelobacter sp.]|nr:enoyl-CoA hydratase-related protein [Candidatus Angelobacter sp.]